MNSLSAEFQGGKDAAPGTHARESIHDTSSLSASLEAQRLVVARVPQGYQTNINIRLVPGRIELPRPRTGCQPRQGAPRRDAEALELPAQVAEKLRDSSKKVVEWLARDPANARLFLAQPVQALAQAGVSLSRTEQKALTRVHAGVQDAAVVGPGVQVGKLSVIGTTRGRVGDKRVPRETRRGGDNDCGCDSRRKG